MALIVNNPPKSRKQKETAIKTEIETQGEESDKHHRTNGVSRGGWPLLRRNVKVMREEEEEFRGGRVNLGEEKAQRDWKDHG